MKPKWWQKNNEKPKTPDWRPVDLTCPCCKSNVVGDTTKRIVIIRFEAQCDHCGTNIAAERKRPLPNGSDYEGHGTQRGDDYDDLPF